MVGSTSMPALSDLTLTIWVRGSAGWCSGQGRPRNASSVSELYRVGHGRQDRAGTSGGSALSIPLVAPCLGPFLQYHRVPTTRKGDEGMDDSRIRRVYDAKKDDLE